MSEALKVLNNIRILRAQARETDLETLEESKNALYQSQKAGIGRRTGLDAGKHKKRLLANRP